MGRLVSYHPENTRLKIHIFSSPYLSRSEPFDPYIHSSTFNSQFCSDYLDGRSRLQNPLGSTYACLSLLSSRKFQINLLTTQQADPPKVSRLISDVDLPFSKTLIHTRLFPLALSPSSSRTKISAFSILWRKTKAWTSLWKKPAG